MEKGLGISALVLAIVAISVPVIGPWLTVIVALIVMFARGPGFGMAIGAIIVNFVNLLLLSPSTWAYFSSNEYTIVPVIWLSAQIIGLVILVSRNKNYNPELSKAKELD